MKLRQIPEDFIVEEVSDIVPSKEEKNYRLYLLEKRSIESFQLLRHLSEKYNIPQKEIKIAGLKDKHAVTRQYMTIPSSYGLCDVKENNLSIKLLGYVDEPLKVGSLIGNRFIISVRDIAKGEIAGTQQKAATLSTMGAPNYFDAQRFGSVIEKEFIAKFLIKKDYEAAVKTYLTTFNKSESKRLKDEKRYLRDHWQELPKIHAKQQPLRNVLVAYHKTKSFLKAYEAIALPIRKMHLQAYQSHLWNECVKTLLKNVVPKTNLYSIEYAVGSLLFYKRISESQLGQMPTQFPLLSADMMLDEDQKAIVEKVLSKEGITLAQISGRKGESGEKGEGSKEEYGVGAYFSSGERNVLVYPAEFTLSEAKEDELNRNRYKMILRFMLPKGSYATIITKRLFNH